MELTRKRHVLLTILCIMGILWSLGNFVSIFSPPIKKISDWAPAIYGIIVAVQFISFIGTWHMKRWGVMLYIFSFFAKLFFSIFTEDISTIGVPLGIAFIIILLVFYKSMDNEL